MQTIKKKPPAAKAGRRSPEPLAVSVREAITRRAKQGELPCALAFRLAEELKLSPAEIGAAADELEIRLVKCQLGLFGYKPEKKIMRAAADVAPELEQMIRGRLRQDRLPCRAAWDIAEACGMPRMGVSGACEALGIKIKPCQLGAF